MNLFCLRRGQPESHHAALAFSRSASPIVASAASAAFAMRASGLRHVTAAAAALAAELDGRRAHQLDSVKAACQIGRDADHDPCLAVAIDADDRDNPGADVALGFIGERFQILCRNSRDDARQQFDTADVLRGLRACRRVAAEREFPAGLGQLAFELAVVLDEACRGACPPLRRAP